MNALLAGINGALFLGIAAALMYLYRQSRNVGFLWLAIPLVLFPILGLPLASWVKSSVDGLAAGQDGSLFPFSLVESGRMSLGRLSALLDKAQHILWSSFMLIGVLMLRERQR